MVIVNISDGLGNQMFQYAFAKYLAVKNEQKLCMISTNVLKQRPFQLGVFNLYNKNFAFRISKAIASNRFTSKIFRKFFLPLIEKRSIKIVQKWEDFRFDPSIGNMDIGNTNLLLIGYWQSEKYFKPIEQIIRDDFSFKGKMSLKTKETASLIKRINSVSIHVRRGDYLLQSNAWAGVCDVKYFSNAIELLSTTQKDLHYFVFSDDIDWCKQNLKIFPCSFIDHNTGKNSYQDMWLMSLCRHNIISNSTFSWWGAWLNKNHGKIVIAPKRWWKEDTVYNITGDIMPGDWVKIDAFNQEQPS